MYANFFPWIGIRLNRPRSRTKLGFGGNYRADLHDPGVLDHIEFRRLPPIHPEEDEVEIAVEAAGLNFKDIMNGMGLLNENAVAGGLTAPSRPGSRGPCPAHRFQSSARQSRR